MYLEDYAEDLLKELDRESLERLARSENGAKLAARFDGDAMESAARKGDMKALSSMLRDILATPEGKKFAAQVQKAVKRDER